MMTFPLRLDVSLRHMAANASDNFPRIVTSAWMAAGMTSRARRPQPDHLAG